jgi:hypothetical protein
MNEATDLHTARVQRPFRVPALRSNAKGGSAHDSWSWITVPAQVSLPFSRDAESRGQAVREERLGSFFGAVDWGMGG